MTRKELIVYEGALCCATGLCGPEPDRGRIAFDETLKRLSDEFKDNLKIMRASLVFNNVPFLANPEILRLVRENGTQILPITTISGEIVATQRYPQYEEMVKFLNERPQEK